MEPAAERAAWLEAQPQPSHLDRHPARPSVAGFGNPLIAVNRAATVVRGCKAEIGRKLPPVAKLPMEDLTHEHMAEVGPIPVNRDKASACLVAGSSRS